LTRSIARRNAGAEFARLSDIPRFLIDQADPASLTLLDVNIAQLASNTKRETRLDLDPTRSGSPPGSMNLFSCFGNGRSMHEFQPWDARCLVAQDQPLGSSSIALVEHDARFSKSAVVI